MGISYFKQNLNVSCQPTQPILVKTLTLCIYVMHMNKVFALFHKIRYIEEKYIKDQERKIRS